MGYVWVLLDHNQVYIYKMYLYRNGEQTSQQKSKKMATRITTRIESENKSRIESIIAS